MQRIDAVRCRSVCTGIVASARAEREALELPSLRLRPPTDLEPAAGTVKEGTIAGQHWEWAGVKNGKKLIVHETVWRMHSSVAPDWPQGHNSITLEGKPRMHINFEATWIDDGLLATGMHALNAVPYVVAAEPGIKTLIDLPWIIGRGTVRA